MGRSTPASPQQAAHGTPKRWLLLTRPAGADAPPALSGLDIECVHQPLLRTQSRAADAALVEELIAAAQLPRRVYVSAAAVQAIKDLDPDQLLLPSAAVGPKTAALLTDAGCSDVWCSADDVGIDALFALPDWQQLAGSAVAIYCASGGRQPAPALLRRLDLRLRMIEVYRRLPLKPPATLIQRLGDHWPSVILSATSVELLRQLDRVLIDAGLTAARTRPLLALSPRIAEQAVALGYNQVAIIDRSCGADIAAALAVGKPNG